MDQHANEAEEAAVRGEHGKVYKIEKEECVVNTEETQEGL
jgi:hypothetical protein